MRTLTNLLFYIFTLFICVQAKELYNDLPSDSIVHKTIIANNSGIVMDENYCNGTGVMGPLVTKLMGEVPYSALIFSFHNDVYSISIKDQCANYILENVSYEDSIELNISIYPLYENEEGDPLSIITGVRKIPTGIIPF